MSSASLPRAVHARVELLLPNAEGRLVEVLNLEYGAYVGVNLVVGPNGSGKTTLLHVLAGLRRPTRGWVRVFGRDPYRDASVKGRIVLAFQEPAYPPHLKVRKALGVYARAVGAPQSRVEEAIESLQLSEYADRRVGELSWGTRRKLELAKVIVNRDADLIMVDEFASLDAQSQGFMTGYLRELANAGKCVVVASHNPLDALWADRITVLSRGRVVREYESFAEVEVELFAAGFKLVVTALNVPEGVETVLRELPAVRSVTVREVRADPRPYAPPDLEYVFVHGDRVVRVRAPEFWARAATSLDRELELAGPEVLRGRILRLMRERPEEAERLKRALEALERGLAWRGRRKLIEVELASLDVNSVLRRLIDTGCTIVGLSTDILTPLIWREGGERGAAAQAPA